MNYALLVDPNTLYPVNYIILQNGNRVPGNFLLLGADLTENQIKELFKI